MLALKLALMIGSAAAARYIKVAEEERVKDSYIVKLAEGGADDVVKHVKEMTMALKEHDFNYTSVQWYLNLAEEGFPAYSATLSEVAVNYLMDLKAVEWIEEDQNMYASQTTDICQGDPGGNSQNGATWGIARTTNCKGRSGCSSNSVCTGNFCQYYYDDKLGGSGVTVFILDTGIYCGNNDFTSKSIGTCTCGFNQFGACSSDTDGNGHGTHCASTAAGATYGVAKNADLVSVKVLSDIGSGSTSGVVNGIDYTAGAGKNIPAVGSMSLGGGASTALDAAVNSCTSSGTQIIAAAGNDNSNACNYSPARASGALTVGSTTNSDTRSSFSNYGTCVDIFAPGSSITAAWINGPSSTTTISGTSMACPHVAGIAAKMLSVNPGLTTNQLTANVLSAGTSNTLSNVGIGSPNLMSYAVCD